MIGPGSPAPSPWRDWRISATVLGVGVLGIVLVVSPAGRPQPAGPIIDRSEARSSQTPADVPAAEPLDTGQPGRPTSTRAGSDPRPADGEPSSSEEPQGGVVAQVPGAGTLEYQVTESGSGGLDTTYVLQHEISIRAPSDGTSVVESRSIEPSGLTRTEVTIWCPAAIERVSEAVGGSGGFDHDCEWQPPLLVIPLPLEVGVRWSNDSRCETHHGAVTQRSEESIARTEVVDVGGQPVEVWVIEGSGTRISGPGTFRRTWTIWFSAEYGVTVKYQRRSSSGVGHHAEEGHLLRLPR